VLRSVFAHTHSKGNTRAMQNGRHSVLYRRCERPRVSYFDLKRVRPGAAAGRGCGRAGWRAAGRVRDGVCVARGAGGRCAGRGRAAGHAPVRRAALLRLARARRAGCLRVPAVTGLARPAPSHKRLCWGTLYAIYICRTPCGDELSVLGHRDMHACLFDEMWQAVTERAL